MEAVESSYAGTRKRDTRGVAEEEDIPVQASDGHYDTAGQGDSDEVLDEVTEESPQEKK